MALRTVGVRLAADVSAYMAGMRAASKSTRDFAQDLDQAARRGRLDAVADQAATMGVGLVAAFGLAVGAAARFDKQMSEVGAVSNATGADLERLRQAALQAGEDTAYSATEAAKAQAELAKAGLSTSDILGGALTGSLSLAAAGSLDLAESADIAAKTMNVFELKGNDVSHIADVLASAANKSATDVHEMGEALRMGGMAANAAGVSLEETVGTLAAFADRALVGSDAGTSLKTTLMMLQAPSDKAAALMEQLGINAYDASGNFIGMANLAGQLRTRLGGLTQEQRNSALATIFGADAMRAANVLYTLGEQGVREYTAAVDDQGAAAEVAAAKTDNLLGDIERLTGSLETMAIEAGSGANGGLRLLVQAADALVDEFSELPPVLSSTATVAAGVAGAAMLMGAGWVRARRANAEALAELRATGPAGVRAATALQTTTRWAGRAATAFVALEVASAALGAVVGFDLNPQLDALGKGLSSWGRDGRLAGEAARVLGKDMEDLNVGLKFLADTDNSRRQWARRLQDVFEALPIGLDKTNTSLTKTRERVSAMDTALAQLVQSGSAQEARIAFERLAASQAEYGVTTEELQKLFPEYAAALETASASSSNAAGAIGDVGAAAGESAEQVKKLNDAFDGLFKSQMDLDKAAIAAKEGMAELRGELTSGARSLSLNTKEGRTNRAAALEQIEAYKNLRDARIAHGESVDSATNKYQQDIRGLQAAMRAAGFNEKAIRQLTDAYLEIPDEARTTVSAPGATGAKKQANDFNFAIRAVPGSKPTRVSVAGYQQSMARLRNLRAEANRFSGTYTATARINYVVTGKPRSVPPGTNFYGGMRWGGITQHAQDGLLRDAGIFSPVGPARYAFAEPATGGEAFIPRFGDYQRSMQILDRAAQWYGARVTPGGADTVVNIGGITITAPIGSSPRDIGRQVADVLDSYCRGGGRVQLRGSVTP